MRDDGTENGEIAGILCDIADCKTKINELHGSQVIQTQALKQQREQLWQMLQNLKAKADQYETDYKLQTWIEIDNLIDNNISDFLSVANSADLEAMLQEIQSGVAELQNTNPDITQLVDQLEAATAGNSLRLESEG